MRAYNSTIRIKEKPCVRCGKVGPIFSKGRCKGCATVEDTLARDEKELNRVVQEEDLSGLIEDADSIFSQYIRLKYADPCGKTKCFTCITVKHWSLLQCGHYIKRAHLYLRWDERNTKPQCVDCNEFKSGNMPEYTRRLELESPGITDILNEEMRLIHKPSRDEIRQVIAMYTPLVKQLKAKLQP